MTMREDVRALLLADAVFSPEVGGERVFLTPLKRPGDADPLLAGYEATPTAFDPVPPRFVRRSLVLQPPSVANDGSTRRTTSMLARWVIALAYYAAPDDEDGLAELHRYASSAIDGRWIDVPGGQRGRIVVPQSTSTAVPIPDLPGSGWQMLGQIEVAHVTR